ncbi:MAG: glucoamylase family protein [Methylococcaceae bacterium]
MTVFFRILFLGIIGTGLAAGNDLHFDPEPVLRQSLLASASVSGPLGGWHGLSGRYPDSAVLQFDGPPQMDSAGHSLHMRYALPAGVDEAFGVRLDLNSFDARDFDHLVFWVKGDVSAGFNPELEVQFRRNDPSGKGPAEIGSFMVGAIGPDWKRVSIPLNYITGLSDWGSLASFVVALPLDNLRVRQGGYFIDEISLIKTGKPGPSSGDLVMASRKKAWEDAAGGETAVRSKLKERLAGWPAMARIDGTTLPKEDGEFLRRVATDTWRGLDALTDRVHGLPLDRVEFRNGSIDSATTHIGDYTNITNIGMHFLAVTAAFELKLINREQALERLAATLNTLESLETYRGFFYNYYNTTTLERTSNFISFVDSSWLTAGLIVARQTFPEVAPRCSHLIDQGNYRFFFDEKHQLMSHGYYVNMGLRSSYHYGVFYAEARLGSLIAIGKGEAPQEHWFRMARTFPAEFDWQTGKPLDRGEQSAGGYHWIGGHYRWRNQDFIPSWGGSLFEALMPTLVLDELRHAPNSLGRNGKVHTLIHRLFALEDLGYPVWGMSPSSTPGSDAYSEYGVRALGLSGYKPGVVTPHAAALALLTEPEEAVRNLRKLAESFPIYGDLGFYDAVDPRSGAVAYNYLCLNQAMILVALADHLADHAVQKRFASDPIITRVLPLLAIEQF